MSTHRPFGTPPLQREANPPIPPSQGGGDRVVLHSGAEIEWSFTGGVEMWDLHKGGPRVGFHMRGRDGLFTGGVMLGAVLDMGVNIEIHRVMEIE